MSRAGAVVDGNPGMETATTSETGGLRAWHVFLVVGLAGAAAAVLLARDTRLENLVMISVTALTIIGAAAAFHRTLAPFGVAEIEDEGPVLSVRARGALEREKMLVLRSIKELEFDRAMGKMAAADFDDMASRLRGRAIGLMGQLDAESDGYRGLIERDLRARLAQAGVSPGAAAGSAEARAPVASEVRRRDAACAACGTVNESDARFCKQCGAKLDAFSVSV
jgi:hypothetical protein